MKEQWKEVDKDMEQRLKATIKHLGKIVNTPPTNLEEGGGASGAAAHRLARWVS
jgi:hypothetical protein